jgi:hypothetical protein
MVVQQIAGTYTRRRVSRPRRSLRPLLDVGYTADNYRSRAFPYFVAGFAFESDFMDVH